MNIKDIQNTLEACQESIEDSFRATDEDTEPSMQVTFACDSLMQSWVYQTGDTSFYGPCYQFPHWSTISIYRDSNCAELAVNVIDELLELTE